MSEEDENDFAMIVKGLELEEPAPVQDVRTMTNRELLDAYTALADKFDKLTHPKTPEEHDEYSRYYTYRMELRRRTEH